MCGMSAIKQSSVASCTQPASKTECEKPYQGARRGGGGKGGWRRRTRTTKKTRRGGVGVTERGDGQEATILHPNYKDTKEVKRKYEEIKAGERGRTRRTRSSSCGEPDPGATRLRQRPFNPSSLTAVTPGDTLRPRPETTIRSDAQMITTRRRESPARKGRDGREARGEGRQEESEGRGETSGEEGWDRRCEGRRAAEKRGEGRTDTSGMEERAK